MLKKDDFAEPLRSFRLFTKGGLNLACDASFGGGGECEWVSESLVLSFGESALAADRCGGENTTRASPDFAAADRFKAQLLPEDAGLLIPVRNL